MLLRSATLVGLASVTFWLVSESEVPRIAAGENPAPFYDSDGDLLPDGAERMLLTNTALADTDGDGIGDFLDAVQHRQLVSNQPPDQDHELRVLLSTERTIDGVEHVVVNVLLRVMGAGRVHSLVPFIYVDGVGIPIQGLLGGGLVHVGYRKDPNEGHFVIASARLCSPQQLHYIMPFTVGVRAVIDDRSLVRGTYVTQVDDVPVAMVPYHDTGFVLQTISPSEPVDDGFWTTSHACELTLEEQGSGMGGVICEIREGNCVGVPTLECAPSCQSMGGGILIIPSGLGTLRGG